MSAASILKRQLVQELTRLPEERLREIRHFVEHLLRQEQQAQTGILLQEQAPAQDPILQYSGGVAHGSLADNIDLGFIHGPVVQSTLAVTRRWLDKHHISSCFVNFELTKSVLACAKSIIG